MDRWQVLDWPWVRRNWANALGRGKVRRKKGGWKSSSRKRGKRERRGEEDEEMTYF